jgi:DNA-binding response OmpR family regulator
MEAYDAATDDDGPRLESIDSSSTQSGGPLLRVLHVEDDEDVRRIVRLSLEGVASIAAAHSMTMARRRLASDAFDLVILDVSLPDGNGLDLLPLNPSPAGHAIPIIVFSAQDITIPVVGDIKAVLIKSRASTIELMRHVRTLAAETRPSAEPERSL